MLATRSDLEKCDSILIKFLRVHWTYHHPSINVCFTYYSLPTRDQFHLTCWVIDVAIGRTNWPILWSTVTVHGTWLSDHWSSWAWSHVRQWNGCFSNATLLHSQHATVQICASISAANQIFLRWTSFWKIENSLTSIDDGFKCNFTCDHIQILLPDHIPWNLPWLRWCFLLCRFSSSFRMN